MRYAASGLRSLFRPAAKPLDPPLKTVPLRTHFIGALLHVPDAPLGQDQRIQHGAVGVHHPTAGAQTRLTVLFEPFQQHRDHLLIYHAHLTYSVGGQLPGKTAGFKRVLTVSSENRAERMPTVRANFDGNAEDKANDYDILISTEVLAEGVNLHRSNVIVNYDTPWNSTRLMQRVGRVNRIGCVAPRIYIYNFYPTTCVDDDIELRKKAIMKLQAFHTALGEDSQIYSETEEVDTFGLFDRSPEEEERDERLA
ncbi:MAG: helicase, partial [Gammaproteobacteria bacterium]|nr:helicase [Gammaproteobacteria bacterium]